MPNLPKLSDHPAADPAVGPSYEEFSLEVFKDCTGYNSTLEGYDWEQAFGCASGVGNIGDNAPPTHCLGEESCSTELFDIKDVRQVLAASEGSNDEADWIALVHLNDGRYAFVEAGCDYTGWGCRAGGNAVVSSTIGNLLQFAVTPTHKSRLKIPYMEY